jgi:undecaprenyl pyrophosphate phosphatase UppP
MIITVSIIFIALGVAIKYGKMYFLIAGYNTMSKEQQETYDIDGIATVFKNAMFGMALIMILGLFVSKWLNNPKIELYAICIAVAIGLPYLLILSNSRKYKIKKDNAADADS